jgi:hypothetical protein
VDTKPVLIPYLAENRIQAFQSHTCSSIRIIIFELCKYNINFYSIKYKYNDLFVKELFLLHFRWDKTKLLIKIKFWLKSMGHFDNVHEFIFKHRQCCSLRKTALLVVMLVTQTAMLWRGWIAGLRLGAAKGVTFPLPGGLQSLSRLVLS